MSKRVHLPPRASRLKLPARQVSKLSNGLTVHLVSRGPLPLLAVKLVIDGGTSTEAAGEVGTADLALRLLRRGADGIAPDEFVERLEFVGASAQGYTTQETFVLSMSGPAGDAGEMLRLFAAMARSPDFPEDEVRMGKSRTVAQMQSELDDPGDLADRAITRAVWGAHPYAREVGAGIADVARLDRNALCKFHRERFGPRFAHLYLVGDVQPDAMLHTVEQLFADWSGGPTEPTAVEPVRTLGRAGEVILVDKPDQTQAQVRLSTLAPSRSTPDYFPLMAMNASLGGVFSSRLMREIRVRRGLSYGAGSGFEMLTAGGAFNVSSFTKPETVAELVRVALAEVEKMRERGPTPVELSRVKQLISGTYPSRLETNEGVMAALAEVVHYRLPETWVEEFQGNMEAVTRAGAHRAASAHLQTESRTMAVVGPAAALAGPLTEFGTVRIVAPAELM